MYSPHLRVTARCLRDDLGLAAEDPSRDARSYCASHEFLRAFVVKREGAPHEGEPTRGIEPFGAYLNLHHGRWRGVTLWDDEWDVCWLLAFSETHASGEDRDGYNDFVSLGQRDELLPTADDYEALELISEANFIDGLSALSADLYDEARANPGTEFSQTYGGGSAIVLVDVMVIDDGEFEEGWLAISFPRDTPLNEDTALDIVAKILPDNIVMSSLQLATSFGKRSLRHDELVFTWDRALSDS